MDSASGIAHGAVVMAVLNAALKAADPYLAVKNALEAQPELWEPLPPEGNIYVLGAGKAGAAMARAAEDILSERISRGLVIVKEGHTGTGKLPLARISLREASHPVPDSRCIDSTAEMLKIAEGAGEDDLVLCLISGGASSLLTAPATGITLTDIQAITHLLLRSGVTINELNAVRKHLSAVSGGMLARIASPARVLSLILSDVTGSPLDVIGSGPTAPDPTTFGEALAILDRYGVLEEAPPSIVVRLLKGTQGNISETPKPNDPLFERVSNILVASNVIAVEAAASCACDMGLNSMVISTYVEGEAREVGKVLAGMAREVVQHSRPLKPPTCLLFGGETTVTVRGNGKGGRNTELALSAALALDKMGQDVVIASLATDGGDGSGPCAGAIVDGTTIDNARNLGLDAHEYLADNDSYTFLEKLGNTIKTGPTGTNVNDVMAIFVF